MQVKQMQMVMDERQRLVLCNISRDRDYLAGLPCGADCGLTRQALGARRIAVGHAKAGIVPLDVQRWLGWLPSPAEQVAFHRAYQKLEWAGLVRRVNLHGGRRTTHLKLTALGERVAERLLAEDLAVAAESPSGQNAQADEATDLPEPIDLDSLDWSALELPSEGPGEPVAPASAVPASTGVNTEKPTEPA